MSGLSTGEVWTAVLLVAVVTAVIKGIGPALLGPGPEGASPLPAPLARVVLLLAVPLLAGLVATSALADGPELVVGGDTAGVAVAGVLVWRGLGVLPAVVLAAVVAGLARLAGLP